MNDTDEKEKIGAYSLRANVADFQKFRDLTEAAGISQGEMFKMVLACWQLNHVTDELQGQADNVKHIQSLLTQISNLFLSQFDALKTLRDSQEQAITAKTTELEQKLNDAKTDLSVLQQQTADEKAQAADALALAEKERDDARAEAKEATGAAEKAAKEAKEIRQKAESALDAVKAQQDALTDAKAAKAEAVAQRDELAKRVDALNQQLQSANTMLAGEKDKSKELASQVKTAQAETQAVRDSLVESREATKEVKAELHEAKADLKAAQADLRDIAKQMNERIDKEKAEAVAAVEPRIHDEYSKKYSAWVETFKKQYQQRQQQKVETKK